MVWFSLSSDILDAHYIIHKAVWHLNHQTNIHIPKTNLIPVIACLYDGLQAHFITFNGVNFSRHSFPAVMLQTQGLQGVRDYFEHTLKGAPFCPSTLNNTKLRVQCISTHSLCCSMAITMLQLYYEQMVSRGEKGDVGVLS
jgi:hypothetical protein